MRIAASETPIFSALLAEFGERRRAAEAAASVATRYAARLADRLRDLEALHEPGVGGECPTCGGDAPCPTLLLARGSIDLDTATRAVRDRTALDGTEEAGPPVPRMVDLLEAQRPGVERFFEALLGRNDG